MNKIFLALCLIALNFKVIAQELPLVVGKVVDTVHCQANVKQSYALYLPKAYTKNSIWSVLFFYDPGARGSIPVKMYSSLAEKYQCILVGSNNSRNGPLNAAQEAEQAILKDVMSRISIAPGRLFISGFSGGARASTFLALQRKMYAGIIACGAAFPVTNKLSENDHVPFVEIVGNLDMNLIEAIETDNYLTKIKYPHSLLFFQGTHTWPPAPVYDQAMFWQLFKLQPPLKSLVESYEKGLLEKTNLEIKAGELSMAYWNLNQAVLPSFKIDSLKKRISSDPLFTKQQKNFATVLEIEKDILREFFKLYEKINYSTHDSTFKENEWKSLLTRVRKFEKSDDILEKQMQERALQEVRIGCFEGYREQMEYKGYLQASQMARVLILQQPEFQSYIMLARAYAKMDRKKEALTALSKAADLGLSNKSILDHSDFSSLAGEKKFIAVKQQVELNAKAIIH